MCASSLATAARCWTSNTPRWTIGARVIQCTGHDGANQHWLLRAIRHERTMTINSSHANCSFASRSQPWQSSLAATTTAQRSTSLPRTRSCRASISRFWNGTALSSLREADDGTFYGTTWFGGVLDKGTLFRMDATGVVTLLHSFYESNDGGLPFGLVRASDGRFYGMTSQGGTFGFGTVFRFVPGGVVTTLHASRRPTARALWICFRRATGTSTG